MRVLIVLAAVCVAMAAATANPGWGAPPPPPTPPPSHGWGSSGYDVGYERDYYPGKWDSYYPREGKQYRHRHSHKTGYVPPTSRDYYPRYPRQHRYPSYPTYPKTEGWGSGWGSSGGGYYSHH